MSRYDDTQGIGARPDSATEARNDPAAKGDASRPGDHRGRAGGSLPFRGGCAVLFAIAAAGAAAQGGGSAAVGQGKAATDAAAASEAPASAEAGVARTQAPSTLSAKEILSRLDANASFATIRYSGRMEITIGGETRVKSMVAEAAGSEKALIEFTNPEDRGIRYLKIGKNLWMYFPKENDTVKISGHLLKEGMMGSDVSYEDALESGDLEARYTAELKGRENVEGRPAYLVALSAKVPTAPYDKRLLKIDAERFVILEEEMYAKSGKLIKTSRTLEVLRVGGRWFASKVEMESKLRRNTRTVFAMEKLELDPKIDASRFTMAALTR